MNLDNICTLRGSGQMLAVYKHVAPHKFAIMLIFKDNSKRFISNETYRTKTQLMHEWQHNRYKFYKFNFTEV